MSGKARIQTQDYLIPEPYFSPSIMQPVILDSVAEFENWKFIKHKILDVQKNQTFGRENPCGHDEMNLFPCTFEQTGGSCSVITPL